MSDKPTSAEVIRDLTRAGQGVLQMSGPDGSAQSVVLLPPGYQRADFDHLLPAPRRLSADRSFGTMAGYVDYLRRFGSDLQTVTFANREKFEFATWIDYHESQANPSWCMHTAAFKPVPSTEVKRWSGIDKKRMAQREMVEFLEDNAEDVLSPDLGVLTGAMRSVKVKRRGDSSHDEGSMRSGRTTNEEVAIEGDFPDIVELALPLFHRGSKYKVKARLRAVPSVQAAGATIEFILSLTNLEVARDIAYREFVDTIPFAVFE